ncbi:DUF4157 domain-containing protein [Streptomyces sp. NBC_00114]|uniref:eCIS core domain-containing protein n=1 Tax=Streptomyces sp. NBC_00114 TaxID=2975656 RepID=UPI003864D591
MRNRAERQNEQREIHPSPARAGVPEQAKPARMIDLQRTVGNAAVARMVARQRHEHDEACGHVSSPQVQRSSVHDVLRSPGRPLDEPVRAEMEGRLGADFSGVRVHDDSTAQRSATEIGARAYTSGHHVVIGAGGADRHTLAHELTHVLQQRRGPVQGTDQGAGLRVSDPGDRFERAAEANATRVMSKPTPSAPTVASRSERTTTHATHATHDASVQRMPEPGSFASLSPRQLGAHPTGTAFIDNDVRAHQATRKAVADWQNTNFAVIQYLDNDTNTVTTLNSFNAGFRAHHSEEALLAHLENVKANYRPIAIFTDRKPCGACETAIKNVANGKARGYDIPIYYISDYPPANVQAIKDWWE